MENNWPETVDELLEECQRLISKNDLYTLGEWGEPFPGETEPRVDGTEYLAGEYQYGVAMIPAQWVTHVLEAATLGSGRVTEDSIDKWMRSFQSEHGELAHIGPDELRELAFALHDDIPLGYEASMRLGQWLLHVALGEEKAGKKSPPEGGPGPCGQPSDYIVHDAATLGDDEYESRMDELLCRLTNGMWSKSRSYSVDFMVGCIDEAYEEAYSGDSATLGRGECEWELEHSGTLYDKWRCSECKFPFVEPRCEQGYTDLEPNYCPKCGRKIRKAVQR